MLERRTTVDLPHVPLPALQSRTSSGHFLVVTRVDLCHDRRPHGVRCSSLLPGGYAMIHHFGVLIPATNTTVEMEYTRLLPPTLQVHVGRLGKADPTPFTPSRPDDIAYQARLLGTARVEVVCLVQTSASLFDEAYDATTTALMTAGAGVPSLTSAQTIGHALQALGARRIALVSPYSQGVLDRARHYFESRYRLEVVAMEGFSATDSYAISTISADYATAAFARLDRPEIEALVVPGGNFPTLHAIATWEQQFHKPVITTNQAALWAMMRVMQMATPLPGLGRLLAQMPGV
jgi:maleate isomerase